MTIYFILQSFLLGWAVTWLFEQALKLNKNLRNKYYKHHNMILGHHVHHSTYGLLAMAIGIILLFLNNGHYAVFWFMFGAGIVFQHTISAGRLVFVEKR